MGWNNDEQENVKKGMNLSSKILLGIIACIFIIIILIIMLLMNMKDTTYRIYFDGALSASVTKDTLLTTIDNVTYVNIEEFAKLVGYEYHKGEYKASTVESSKCYVEGEIETASFYSDGNKIYKLHVDKQDEQYEEYIIKNPVKMVNEKMYTSIEGISRAFNVLIAETSNELQIYTLDYLITIYDTNVKNWGYTGIAEQSFENKKALLQGFLIVKKEGGLYKIIDTDNTKEIVLDRYTAIEFSENMQEFFVTSSSGLVGIVNLDGTTQIEPVYDSIQVLDKESDLYIIEQSNKFGVVKGNNINVIYPQYDSIGVNSNSENDSKNKKLILDTLIPVCKDKKWGAYDKEGRLILNVEYDGLGYNLNSIEIDGIKEVVEPVLAIKRCNGVIVEKAKKFGLLSIEGKELVRIAVDGIYALNGIEDEDLKYFMLYNNEELNVIERLVKAGLIEENDKEEITEPIEPPTVNNEVVNTENETVINNVEVQ